MDDLREIVAYAAERNIQIIPEIDMPGHMTACIVAYPELGCNPEKKIEVMTEGGMRHRAHAHRLTRFLAVLPRHMAYSGNQRLSPLAPETGRKSRIHVTQDLGAGRRPHLGNGSAVPER
ncbi:MAG: family 20 glycosylhydrolase [Bacteroidaceae bacterium]|nr:family 20 glycosylhydrolase [Bacteroidaceae bacterium]